MNVPEESRFELLWKGRQSGPFALNTIREKLGSGEISRMHQVNFRGKWIVLDEFLEKHAGEGLQTMRQAEAGQRSPLSHLLPRSSQTEHPEQSGHLSDPRSEPESSPTSSDTIQLPLRTSLLAIAALAISVCNLIAIAAMIMGLYVFVPYRDLIPGILTLVAGHMALSEINRDSALQGRGMAITSLAITYFLLVMGLTLAALMLLHHQNF